MARGVLVKKFLHDRGYSILDALDQVAKQLHSTDVQVKISWMFARPTVTAPFASSTRLAQLKQLMGEFESMGEVEYFDLTNPHLR